MKQKKIDLGSGSVGKLMFTLALPTITSQVVNMLYNLVDRVYIGHMAPVDTVGKLALTGVGVCLPIIMIVSAFAFLVAMGGAPRASIQEGRGNPRGSEEIMGNCFTMLIFTSMILTVILYSFARPLLLTFGAEGETIDYAVDYLHIYSLGTLFVQMTLGMNAYITAQGFTGTSMKVVLVGAILNTILDPIFIFGLKLGVKGAALATVVSQAVSTVLVLRFICSSRSKWHLKREFLRPRGRVVMPCLALGLSPFIMQSTESLVAVCFNTSLLKYGGSLAVGAMTVLSSVMNFALMPVMGLTQGVQPLISYNFGARNVERVKKAVKLQIITCFIYAVTLWGLIELFPQIFVLMFNNSPDLVKFTVWALRIYMACLFMFGIQAGCQQAFVAIGSAVPSIFLALLRKIILLIPLIYLLPHLFADKTFAIFLAEPVADATAATVTGILFAVRFRRTMAQMEAGTLPEGNQSGKAD